MRCVFGILVCLGLVLRGESMAGDAYAVRTADFKGHVVYVLTDARRGQEARVLPSVGNNCVSFQIQQGERTVDLIYTPPDPKTLQGRPSGYGTPILFPWPNRIDGGVFAFDGKTYQLDTPRPGAHASHGFVLNRPWTVAGSGASDADGAWIRSRFRAADYPEIMRPFPFPFEAVVTYRLKDGALTLAFEGTNTGTGDMPAGLGIHPYFPLPLAAGGSRDACSVQIPAGKYWPLREGKVPSGEVLPVSGVYDLRQATSLKNRYYDDVWTGVALTDGWSRCVYVDSAAGVGIAVEGDAIFREWVLYAPEQRPIVCFEPYTCTTNAVNLQTQGIDAGLVRLAPGGKLLGTMRIVPEGVR